LDRVLEAPFVEMLVPGSEPVADGSSGEPVDVVDVMQREAFQISDSVLPLGTTVYLPVLDD
jgi:hypothetical protein